MEFNFILPNEDSLILVDSEINDLPFTLAIDTGASHTVVDLTALLMAGYSLSDSKGTIPMETAKGNIDAHIFEVDYFYALGREINKFKVCSYDFLANQVLVNIDGVLGLDFYRGKVLTLDFLRSKIIFK